MIQLDSVSKRYGDVTVLDDISLTIAPGETKVLLGTSGCGKSTILRLMIGLIEPSAGTISIEGQLMSPGTDWEPIRQRMGYVIQDGGLFPHLTARGNACLMANHLGWDGARTDARLRELAQLTRLPLESLERYPAELSGGQRQRVSLIRALMLDPQIMLLDEPLGALDPITRADLQDDLNEIAGALHKTVVLVTHDIGEAALFGDDIVLLRQGTIVQQGPFEELLSRPVDEFVTRFINSQRRPVLEGEPVSDDGQRGLGE